MIRLEPHPEGTILPVHARPGARRTALGGEHDGALRVSVAQAPEKGKANKAIIELLAKEFDVRRGQIELVSGETSPRKRLLVRGLAPEELSARIAARE